MAHWIVAQARPSLFGLDVPEGFEYQSEFVTADEETLLAAEIGKLQFANFEMRGVVARRRVAFFGHSYDAGDQTYPPIPVFLHPLRDRIATWGTIDPRAFAMALINEYRPGSPIGWHRDAPQYGIVAGVSLVSSCRMKFRPYVRPSAQRSVSDGRRTATHEILLEPRSAYLMTGESRSAYEHHIPAVSTLRYSITFRTLRS